MEQIRADGIPVAAPPLQIRLPAPDDEPFLEVAIAGRARSLVTGNLKHYPEAARAGVAVLAPRAFIELYRATECQARTRLRVTWAVRRVG